MSRKILLWVLLAFWLLFFIGPGWLTRIIVSKGSDDPCGVRYMVLIGLSMLGLWLFFDPWIRKLTAGRWASFRYHYLLVSFFLLPLIFIVSMVITFTLSHGNDYYWGVTRSLKIKAGVSADDEGCYKQLVQARDEMNNYRRAHGGRLAPALGPQDYFYWRKMLRNDFLFERPQDFYCPQNLDAPYPGSYMGNPELAGQNLRELKNLDRLVVLRELNYYHRGKSAWFVLGNKEVVLLSRREAQERSLINPMFPGEDDYLLYWHIDPNRFWLLVYVLLTALGYCALNAWAKRR